MLRISGVISYPARACRCFSRYRNVRFETKTFLDSVPHCFLAAEYEEEENSPQKIVPTSNSKNYFKGVILARTRFNGRYNLCLFAEDQIVDALKEPRQAKDQEELGK